MIWSVKKFEQNSKENPLRFEKKINKMTRKKITGEITHLYDSDGIQTILVEYS